MTRGKQTDLARALDGLARKLDKKSSGRYSQVRVAAAWEKVAGPTVAAHTTRAHIRAGELVVYVDSPVWATELSALAGPYKESLNTEIGHNAVRSVRFAVSPKVQQARRHAEQEALTEEFYQPDPTIPVALSAVERAQVEASAAAIEDIKLREAVIKATIASMEWRKGRRAAKSRQEPRDGL